MSRSLAALYLIAAMALTGANVPFGKAIVAEIPVYVFLVLRFAVATAVLACLLGREPGPSLTRMSRTDLRDLALLSGLGSIAFTVFLMEGIKRTSAVDAGIILATLPIATALLGGLLRGERPRAGQTAAIVCAVAGLAIVNTTAGSGDRDASALGNLLVCGAVACEAIFVLVSSRMSAVYRPVRLSFAVSGLSLAASLPLAIPQIAGTDFAAISPGIWLLATWYALAASVFCTVLWYRGVAHVETWFAGLATAAIPVVALAVAATVYAEPVGVAGLAGAALVILAIALGTRSTGRAPQARDRAASWWRKSRR